MSDAESDAGSAAGSAADVTNDSGEGFYPHPLSDDEDPYPVLLFREQYLREFSQAIREKPNWTQKITDRTLLAKWIREAKAQPQTARGHKVVQWNSEDIEFVKEELLERYKPYVESWAEKGGLQPDLDGVWRTDTLIDDGLRQELIDAVATLENVPDDMKDWHPGSDGKVLDLVHPSLWPLIYSRSISLLDGKPIKLPEDFEGEEYSDEFCWLPSEFEVSEDGSSTKIKSYINNLSLPEQKALFYPILEKIFTKFVPLFNHVLADLRRNQAYNRRVDSPDGYAGEGEETEWLLKDKHDELWEKLIVQFEKQELLDVSFADHIEEFEGSDGDERKEEYQEGAWAGADADGEDERPYEIRDLGTISSINMWNPPVETLPKVKLEGKTLKVIVKLANILLTPEKPTYDGGTWHVEAMLNERIISTGIYYYAQDNVTDSHLAFRRNNGDLEDTAMEQPQDSEWMAVHDMSREGESVQDVGQILTKNGRAIAFPNIMHHQVQPFELVDKEKPGYRKILVFFLCDPSPEHNIPTTKTVAPQQPEGRAEFIDELRLGPLGKLPEDVFRSIMSELPPVITLEEAKKLRDELMEERSNLNDDCEKVKGYRYSFCEH